MTLFAFLSLIITAILAVGGWYVAHRLNVSRDRANKRRELRVKYLIDAYRQLEWASNRPFSRTTAPKFESALADIQLFGTAKQVRMAQMFAVEFARNLTSSLDELLEDLRSDLRRELDLEEVPEKFASSAQLLKKKKTTVNYRRSTRVVSRRRRRTRLRKTLASNTIETSGIP